MSMMASAELASRSPVPPGLMRTLTGSPPAPAGGGGRRGWPLPPGSLAALREPDEAAHPSDDTGPETPLARALPGAGRRRTPAVVPEAT